MNKQFRIYLIIITSIVVCGAAFAYGALTAPRDQNSTEASTAPVNKPVEKTTDKADPAKKLAAEMPTITTVVTAAYPLIVTDYSINKGYLTDDGQWFGATLTYKGSDVNNRDTLRILMQKKNGTWVLRTTPPELLLSAKKFPDAPKKFLQKINQAISLPAGAEGSPTISVGE